MAASKAVTAATILAIAACTSASALEVESPGIAFTLFAYAMIGCTNGFNAASAACNSSATAVLVAAISLFSVFSKV